MPSRSSVTTTERDARAARVTAIVGVLHRIGQHGHAGRAGQLDQPRDHRPLADALVVVADEHQIDLVDRAGDARKDLVRRGRCDCVIGLAVHAHHLVGIALLGATQEPFLERGGPVGDRQHEAVVDVQVIEELADEAALVVFAHGGGQDRLGSQGGEHRGHAPGAPQPVLAATGAEDGDGGFRADAFHIAPHVAVQHHVAHQQHAGAEVPFQQSDRSSGHPCQAP
jgi:hypothetical protein